MQTIVHRLANWHVNSVCGKISVMLQIYVNIDFEIPFKTNSIKQVTKIIYSTRHISVFYFEEHNNHKYGAHSIQSTDDDVDAHGPMTPPHFAPYARVRLCQMWLNRTQARPHACSELCVRIHTKVKSFIVLFECEYKNKILCSRVCERVSVCVCSS